MELRGGGNASRRHREKHQIAGNPVHEGDLKRNAVGGRDESEISGSSACHIIHRRLKAAVAIAEQKGNSVGVRVGRRSQVSRPRISTAGCRTVAPARSFTCWRHEVPVAARTSPCFISFTAGSKRRLAMATETS